MSRPPRRNGGKPADAQQRERELLARIDVERGVLLMQAQALRRPLRNADRVGHGLHEIRRSGSLPLLLLPGALMLWRARPVIRVGLRVWATWKLLRRVSGIVKATFVSRRLPAMRHGAQLTGAGTGGNDGRSLSGGLLVVGTLVGGLLIRKTLSLRRRMHKEQQA